MRDKNPSLSNGSARIFLVFLLAPRHHLTALFLEKVSADLLILLEGLSDKIESSPGNLCKAVVRATLTIRGPK